ncbi:MAG: metal ABC transporter permease [Deinococcus sp.]|nr:metal ABC transporter permease [Deinococcus sp.]
MDTLWEALQRLITSPVMPRALLGGTLIALVGPVLGVFLLLRRYALLADGIGHIVFGGIGFAFFAGLNPTATALVAAVLSGLGIEQLRAQRRLSGDTAIAIFLTTGLGTGLLFARLGGVSAGVLERYLFGNLATISSQDLWLAALAVAGVLLALALTGKELFAITFDEESAQASGLSVRGINRLLAVLAALVVVGAMRITGLLLISALIVLPVAASLQLARSFARALVLAALFGVIIVDGGLLIAYYANWVPSGTIVLTGAVWFTLIRLWQWLARMRKL